jgi:hypothetical protein
MSQPTVNDVQAVDPILTNMLVGYKQADARFVSSQIFPSVPVDKMGFTYYILTKKYWFVDEMQKRAPGGRFARGGFGVESATGQVDLWGLEYPVPDEDQANSQLPLTLEGIGTQWLAQQSLIRKERAWAADFMAASVWTTQDNNATTDWDDFSAGDPVKDIKTGKRAISQLTGQTPNTLLVGEIVDDAITLHPDILDRIKYTVAATGAAVDSAVAAILKVQRYIVATAIYNSANEGQAASYAPIIDDDALLCYVTPAPGLFVASAGYTFGWTDGGGDGVVVPYRDQKVKSNILQTSEAWDQKVVAADLGAIWLDVV